MLFKGPSLAVETHAHARDASRVVQAFVPASVTCIFICIDLAGSMRFWDLRFALYIRDVTIFRSDDATLRFWMEPAWSPLRAVLSVLSYFECFSILGSLWSFSARWTSSTSSLHPSPRLDTLRRLALKSIPNGVNNAINLAKVLSAVERVWTLRSTSVRCL
jgi:hypothetical protein